MKAPCIDWPSRLAWHVVASLGRLPMRWRWAAARLKSRGFLSRPSPWLEFAKTNLAVCFPHWSLERRRVLLESVAFESALSLFNRLRALTRSERGLRRMVEVENLELFHRSMSHGPVILLCPHFVGLELAGLRLGLETRLTVIYAPSGNAQADALHERARLRFGPADLLPRGASLRPALSKLRQGQPLLLAPDLDLGARGAVFAPFFGVLAATTKTTAWAAARSAASVLPISIRRVEGDRHVMTIHEPVAGLSGDLAEDMRRINAVIESLVVAAPEHYWWDQPRFFTRPAGDASPYSAAANAFARNCVSLGNSAESSPPGALNKG
jgi:Kdo2-lipid IVA lauroyltransferase/acyltransferase